MATGKLLSDELQLPDLPVESRHPTDSSRILLGLMSLARQAEAAEAQAAESHLLAGAISRGVLRSLLAALHFRDVATVRHCRRVALLCAGMARHLGWEEAPRKALEIAALLHDIGKIGVPDNILFKPGKLSTDEAALMALHHNIGVDVLQACRVDKGVVDIIVQAHRHYDGADDGSHRLWGNLHQGARLLAVADAYDSLSTEQVYRERKSHAEIMPILTDAAGTQFDPSVVAALGRWIDSEGNPFETAAGDLNAAGNQGPTQPEDVLEASSLCHIFSYLYVLESLYDGFYLVDADLRFVVWNRGAERLFGFPAGDMLQRVWSGRVLRHGDRYGQPLAEPEYPMNRVIVHGKGATSTVKIQRADGNWVDVETQSVPLIDEEGRLQGVAEIFRDLSRSSQRPQEYRDLKLAATRDALTSAANRGELETQLTRLVSEFSRREGAEPFSVLFLDIDHFKSINDTYGHTVGDQVLMDLARLLKTETYSGELVGRYGGEEFVILCPGTDLEQAHRRAERLRTAIVKAKIGGMADFPVTASFGVAQAEPGDSVESILRRADKALYTAKETGRNKTCSQASADSGSGRFPAALAGAAPPDPFVYRGTFFACIAADMVIYKLGGFVHDHRAALKEVAPRRAVLQVGRRGLLPLWGGSDESRPVAVELEFGDSETVSPQQKRAASRQVSVKVCIRPLGWVRDSGIFQERARGVLKTLRSYFAAT